MRYIGSKNQLLEEIEKAVNSLPIKNKKDAIFCDLFSGTGVVANYFKEKFTIISNDLLNFSYLIQVAKIENNSIPNFFSLKKLIKSDPIDYLNNLNVKDYNFKNSLFIAESYTPFGSERQYFTEENGKKIDLVLDLVTDWHQKEIININEYQYLIASLVEAVPFISNIAGTFGAYLKHWDSRSFKKLELKNFEVFDNGKKNKAFNLNSNSLIREISGDVLYLDPPYNERQYLPYYHLLETISKNDRPAIYGKTGMRPYTDLKSSYCVKSEVLKSFEDLILNAKFKFVVMSYSSEGLMRESEIEDILSRYAVKGSYKLFKIPYRKYKSNSADHLHELNEFIFTIEKRF